MKTVQVKVLPGEYFYTPQADYRFSKAEKSCGLCDSTGTLHIVGKGTIKCNKCRGKGVIKTDKSLQVWKPKRHKCISIRVYSGHTLLQYEEATGWSSRETAVNQAIAFVEKVECEAHCEEMNRNEKWKVL